MEAFEYILLCLYYLYPKIRVKVQKSTTILIPNFLQCSQHRILGPSFFLGVVGGEVEAAALFSDGGAFGNEVAYGDHVAQLAQLWTQDGFFVEFFGFFVQ